MSGGPYWPEIEDDAAFANVPLAVHDAPEPSPVACTSTIVDRRATESEADPRLESVVLRQGLPRRAGGDPWPPVGASRQSPDMTVAAIRPPSPAGVSYVSPESHSGDVSPAPASRVQARSEGSRVATGVMTHEFMLRRGLPRATGGDHWPSAGTATVLRPAPPAMGSSKVGENYVAAEPAGLPVPARSNLHTEDLETPTAQASGLSSDGFAKAAVSVSVADHAPPSPPMSPASVGLTAPTTKVKRKPILVGSRSLLQWWKLCAVWGGGTILAAGIIVLAARGITTLPGVPEFMGRYPGDYAPPAFVEAGFPAWARWSHYLNFFFMVLIVRTGLLVRTQQKPDAFFTPKSGGKKISIYLWLHTSIDILWLLNGALFVVLLFTSGHWARIVPTSWEVFPNAFGAGLQYLTLEWPHEDGWVNYNSLQQLMYFTVVFIAAPLAAITGIRMSEWWPKRTERLNKLYPAPIARAVHFPTMLFFVLFVIVHVFLVLSTGTLKNLNHMFAGTPEPSWVGFSWFAGGLLVAAIVTWAARPMVLAPIASLFGKVSER